jgi:hypothetical protein
MHIEQEEGVDMATQQQSIVKQGQQNIIREGAFDLTPHSLQEAFQLAELMAKSELVPQGFRNRPADVLIAVQYGAELGLPPLQALSGIAVINGRACIWGDAALGVVMASGTVENIKEMTFPEIAAAGKAVFWGKRKGIAEPFVREFTLEDAKRAGLLNKKGPWSDYQPRMLQMRARGFGLRDGWSDILKGVAIREEVEDFTVTEAPATLAMPRRLSERTATTESLKPAPDPEPTQDASPLESENKAIFEECPKCNGEMKYFPAGITKTGKNAGKPHDAYWKCTVEGCAGFKWADKPQDREPGAEG